MKTNTAFSKTHSAKILKTSNEFSDDPSSRLASPINPAKLNALYPSSHAYKLLSLYRSTR